MYITSQKRRVLILAGRRARGVGRGGEERGGEERGGEGRGGWWAKTWHGPPGTSFNFIFCLGVLSAWRMIATTHLPGLGFRV